MWAFADNLYRVNIKDSITGCYMDTTIEIPGYEAIQAAFTFQKQSSGDCISPLDELITFYNQSAGGTSGTWFWGDGSQTPFSASVNPMHPFDGRKEIYTVILAIQNDGGCTDTAVREICYHDTVILYLPNAFSPNGDGLNDVYQPAVYGASEMLMTVLS